MGNRNRSNVLLVEILIAVLFFMLSATVLVRVFVTARNMTVRSGVEAQALTEAQNVAEAQNVTEAMYAASDPEAALDAMGFSSAHGAWTRDYGDYTLYVECGETNTDAGRLWQAEVSAMYHNRNADLARQEDDELFTLPCVRYEEGQA